MTKKPFRKGIVPIIVIVIVVSFMLLLALMGMALWSKGEPTSQQSFGGTISGCGIPDDWAKVFSEAVQGYHISASLVAAIFYAGEHGNSWPKITGECTSGNCNGGWAVSSAGAHGPFQFMESTWKDYGTGPYENANDVNLSARAAAHLLSANYDASHGNEKKKIRDAIYRYNHSQKYVDAVYNKYLEFLNCQNSGSGTVGKDGHVFPLAKHKWFGGWLADRCSGTGSGTPHAHGGADIMHDKDDPVPVYAVTDGIIIKTGKGTIRLKSLYRNDSYTYFYSHLSQIKVTKNSTVKAGQLIGLSAGYAGGARGDHTHFGITKNPTGKVEIPISSCQVSKSQRARIAASLGLIDPTPILNLWLGK